MKPNPSNSPVLKVALPVSILLGVALFTVSAGEKSSSQRVAQPSSKAAVDHPLSEPVIRQSLFIVPSTTSEGKDPFFPHLTDRFSAPPTAKPVKPSNNVGVDALTLQGVAGHTNARICVINGRTFAIGDEDGVPTSSGRVQIRCLEINETNVVIELGGERRELWFKPRK
jgi:hypothetical protein